MKNLRLPIITFLGVAIICLVVGSFIDLDAATKIFSQDNTFGITIAAIGLIPAHGFVAFLAGILLWCCFQYKHNKVLMTAMIVGALVAIGAATYFAGDSVFDENGFNNKDIAWSGMLICLPFMAGFAFLGYLVGKKVNNPQLWVFATVMLLSVGIALGVGVLGLKNIMHRPRYRIVVRGGLIDFYPWWKRCSNYKDFVGLKEEFKSFPSGHAITSFMMAPFLGFLGLYFKKLRKYAPFLFLVGGLYAIFICYTRMLVGAHYLTDVSTGTILCSLFVLIGNELLINVKKIRETLKIEE